MQLIFIGRDNKIFPKKSRQDTVLKIPNRWDILRQFSDSFKPTVGKCDNIPILSICFSKYTPTLEFLMSSLSLPFTYMGSG